MENNLKIFIVGFIAILIGTILIGEIADNVYENTQMPTDFGQNNESVTSGMFGGSGGTGTTDIITANCNMTLDAEDVISIQAVGLINGSTLAVNTDYTTDFSDDDAVLINFLNTTDVFQITFNENRTLVNYTMWHVGYIRGSAVSRTLVGLLPIFFAIGILSVGLWMVWKGFKDLIS